MPTCMHMQTAGLLRDGDLCAAGQGSSPKIPAHAPGVHGLLTMIGVCAVADCSRPPAMTCYPEFSGSELSNHAATVSLSAITVSH